MDMETHVNVFLCLFNINLLLPTHEAMHKVSFLCPRPLASLGGSVSGMASHVKSR